MQSTYLAAEVRGIKQMFHAGGDVTCPRCDVAMDRRDIPPRSDVSYVRDRVWLTCPSCHATAVVDRRPGA